MSQHDFNIANQGFPSFRTDLNNALVALATTSSGTAEPATTYANQLWYETDTNTLHIRNEANSAWLDLMVIDQTTGSPSFMAGNVGIGTSSPQEKLVVEGASPFILVNNTDETRSGIRFADAQNTGERFQLAFDASPGAMCFDRIESTGVVTERMRIDASGNVGIGTSPGTRFHALTSAATIVGRFESTSASNACTIDFTNPAIAINQVRVGSIGADFQIVTAATERMKITSAGSVYMPYVYADTVTGRDLYISSTGQLGYVSSTRASKTNIEDLSDVSWLYSLNPVSFQYRVRNEDGTYSDEAQPQPEYGLIAEEVEEVNPDLVFYDETESGKELRGVQYSRLIAPLLKAIQEQQKMISALEARIVALGG